jgi:tellurite resistance protein
LKSTSVAAVDTTMTKKKIQLMAFRRTIALPLVTSSTRISPSSGEAVAEERKGMAALKKMKPTWMTFAEGVFAQQR